MSRRLVFSNPFVRDYQALPDEIKAAVDKALGLLLTNPRHPSFQTKKMQPAARGVFEARVTKAYRATFQINGANVVLRRVGTHDILKTP